MATKTLRPRLARSLIALAIFAPTGAQATPLSAITYYGQSVDAAGTTLVGFQPYLSGSIADNGTVAICAWLQGDASPAILAWDNSELRTVARAGVEAVPGDGPINYITSAAIARDGTIWMVADTPGPQGYNPYSATRAPGGTYTFTRVPPVLDGYPVHNFQPDSAVYVSRSGAVSFYTVTAGTPYRLIHIQNGSAETLAAAGPQPDGSSYFGITPSAISPSGRVLFAYLGNSGPHVALYEGTPHHVARIAGVGDHAPGTDATFASIYPSGYPSNQAINDAGRVAFTATLSGANVTAANNEGLWTGAASGLQLLAREGDPAPGTSDTFKGFNAFPDLSPPRIAPDGTVTFSAKLTGSNSGQGEGIWTGLPGHVAKVAAIGDPAPGTVGVFSSFSYFTTNDAGLLAFTASYTLPDSSSHSGLWAGTPDSLSLILQAGDPLLLGSDVATIDTLTIPSSYSGNDGSQYSLNERDQLLVNAHLTDGRTALTIVSIPEPASLLPAFILSLLLRRRSRRCRTPIHA